MENKELIFDSNIDKLIKSSYLTREAPTEEPYRQYWFMKKARELTEEKSRELNRRLTFCVNTFGCQMNARDSEKLVGVLDVLAMWKLLTKMQILLFTIPVQYGKNANLRVYGRLGYLHSLKKKNPHMMIGLCGCMMQEPVRWWKS